jgi:hypothetical protein
MKIILYNKISDFDKIREIEKIHRKTIHYVIRVFEEVTLMCVAHHGQPYKMR